MSQTTEAELNRVLAYSARKLGILIPVNTINLVPEEAHGFLSELYRCSIRDEMKNETVHLVIKKSPPSTARRPSDLLCYGYRNEMYFYDTVMSELRGLEKHYSVYKRFNSIPEYVNGYTLGGKDYVVLKDLTTSGFESREHSTLLDDEHVKRVFQVYGHFHALSFCLLKRHVRDYHRVIDPIVSVWAQLLKHDKLFVQMFEEQAQRALEAFDADKDKHIIEKFQKYVDNTKACFQEAVDYKGLYPCILHGDGWTNNLMFKYAETSEGRIIKDVRLLDFQLLNVGSPIFDLSCFLYAGASEELFKNIEIYLDLYHNSFCDAIGQLGVNGAEYLPRDELEIEWKENSKVGMILSLVLVKAKLMRREDIYRSVNRSVSVETPAPEQLYDPEEFNTRIRAIFQHVYKMDAF